MLSDNLFRFLFNVLYDKLDELARQCQAVNSHLQICESSAIDAYTGSDQILMSENPVSQRFLEIVLEGLKKLYHCYYKLKMTFYLICLYTYTTKCIKKNIFSSKKFLCRNFFEFVDGRSANTVHRLGGHVIVLC